MSGDTLTRESFVAAYPELALAIESDGYQKGYGEGYAKGKEEGLQAGAQAERERVKAVEEQAIPGHEALIQSLKFDGKTNGAEAAVKVLAAERSLRAERLEQFKKDGAEKVKQPAVSAVEGETKKDFESLVAEYQAEKKCSRGEAIRAVARDYPQEHEEYIARVNKR